MAQVAGSGTPEFEISLKEFAKTAGSPLMPGEV